MLNLSIWFSLNAMFGRTGQIKLIGAVITVPEIQTADWFALALVTLSCLAMKYLKLGDNTRIDW